MIFQITFYGTILYIISEIINTWKKGHIISIQLLVAVCFFVFLLIPPYIQKSNLIYDDSFNYILLVGLIGIIIGNRMIKYDILVDGIRRGVRIKRFYRPKKHILNLGFIIYISYLIIDLVITIISHGSIIASFQVDRINTAPTESGSLLSVIMIFFKILFYVKTYKFYILKKHFKFIFFYSIPMIHLLFTAMTRFDFLALLLILLYLYLNPLLIKNYAGNKKE